MTFSTQLSYKFPTHQELIFLGRCEMSPLFSKIESTKEGFLIGLQYEILVKTPGNLDFNKSTLSINLHFISGGVYFTDELIGKEKPNFSFEKLRDSNLFVEELMNLLSISDRYEEHILTYLPSSKKKKMLSCLEIWKKNSYFTDGTVDHYEFRRMMLKQSKSL